MSTDGITAAIAFFALGANLFTAILLLLLNPGSRSMRWYIAFVAVACVWLLGQGSVALSDGNVMLRWLRVELWAVALMPGVFMAFALMDDPQRPGWLGYALVLLSLVLSPVVVGGMLDRDAPAWQDAFAAGWMIVGWLGASIYLWFSNRRQYRTRAQSPLLRKRLVIVTFLLMAPVSVIGAILLESAAFIAFVLPLLVVLIQVLVFYGITRMQLYDIDVRVRRAGELAAETAETERLAVLGGLAATIAHEVRNPLTGVRSLAQRIAQDDVGLDKRQRYAQVILDETERVERLVSNLLDVARRSARNRDSNATTDLAALCDDLQLLVAARAARQQVQLGVNIDVAVVSAPREALAQVLLNLLLNAITHAPAGTQVELFAESRNGAVEIGVRDRGRGIPAEERERIFEPFYTTQPQGSGLGLSVVRHVAQEHGWRVQVVDAEGGGSEFRVTVPAS